EDLPFADGSVDFVVSRLGAHHFDDVRKAVQEMARVAAQTVVIVDNTFVSDELEQAEKLRDPSHVRCYTPEEWRSLFEQSGLGVDDVRFLPQLVEVDPWLARAGCEGEEAERVKEL